MWMKEKKNHFLKINYDYSESERCDDEWENVTFLSSLEFHFLLNCEKFSWKLDFKNGTERIDEKLIFLKSNLNSSIDDILS